MHTYKSVHFCVAAAGWVVEAAGCAALSIVPSDSAPPNSLIMAEEDDEFMARKLSWDERLSHEDWNVRNEANIDLALVCDSINDPKDPRLREFGPLFKKAVSDSNPTVQESALNALIAYLRIADADAGRYTKEICDAVVAKCLTGRPKTMEKAQTAFLLCVELESIEAFLESMEKTIKIKDANAVVLAIETMTRAVSEFGTNMIPVMRILCMLPELFYHEDQNVRTSANGLTMELCKWIGKETVKSILFEKMQDTMRKELEQESDNATGVQKSTQRIRSKQAKELTDGAVPELAFLDDVDETSGICPQISDEYDLMDSVDILMPLERSGFWEGVKAAEWLERHDAVEKLTKLACTKKISPGDFTEVSYALKKLIADVNIAVAVEAVQATCNLARGLRKNFNSGSRVLLPLLLEKLEEENSVMIEALMKVLQTIHNVGCLSLAEITEEVKVAINSKVPAVRSLTLNWVSFCIETSSKATVLGLHKDYVVIAMESVDDCHPGVRDAAFSTLVAIVKVIDMKPVEKSLEKLDDIRRKELAEIISRSLNHQNLVLAPVSVPGTVLMTGSDIGISEGTIGKDRKGTSENEERGREQDKLSGNDSVADAERGSMNLNEIEEKAGLILQEDVLTNLKSTDWKERFEAMISLQKMVGSLVNIDAHTELLVQLLSFFPGWDEKNVQVQQKMVEVVTDLCQRSSTFSKQCVVLCILGVGEGLCDLEIQVQAVRCLSAFCEAVGPRFVFDRLFKIMKEHEHSKVVSEGLAWMATAVEDFGLSDIILKDVIDFCKEVGLQSNASAIRSATLNLIGVLYKFVGPDIGAFLDDVKPELHSGLDAEYDKDLYEGIFASPERSVQVAHAEDAGKGTSFLPPKDISSKLTLTLLKNLSSHDWKVRQESIEGINKIIEEANKRIQSTGTGEMFEALKGRLYDSNKNLVTMAIIAVGNLASAMGPSIEKASKDILADVLKCLGDKKKQIRETAIKTLDSWITVVHFTKMLPYIIAALGDVKFSSDGRKEIFEWLTKHIAKLHYQPELMQLIKPIASALQDKSVDLRRTAEVCLLEIIKDCKDEQVSRALMDLQGSALAAVQPILDKQRFSANVSKIGINKGAKVAADGSRDRVVSKSVLAGSRAIANRSTPLKISKQAAAVAAQDAAVQGQALFDLRDSNKAEREKSISRKFKFEESKPEQIQEIEVDIMKYFREDLYRRLLSLDSKMQVDGLEILRKAIPLYIKEMAELVDVLLRWCALRFLVSNTTCLLKVIEFLTELVEALKNEVYTFTEYEAAIFFPCLVEKSGHYIAKVREKMRELAKLMCCIYPASKLFVYILEGLRSRNNRTRVESVDHIAFMIERYGIEIVGPTKALQSLAALTLERDVELRKAALQAIAAAYKFLGEDIWRYTGRLSDTQRSMLDDKFKWKAREMDKRSEGRPGEIRLAIRQPSSENGEDVTEQSGEVISRTVNCQTSVLSGRSGNGHFDDMIEHASISTSTVMLSTPVDWNEALDMIENGISIEQVVEGMKFVCHELNKADGESESNVLGELVKDADRLVSQLTMKVADTFTLGHSGASSRSCKYVLNTLMQTFQLKKLARGVNQGTLNKLITELLIWLLDERVALMDDGSQLLKALNVLMLKILENVNRTSAFVVLIQLLKPLDPSIWPNPAESASIRGQRFSELVVKCLIKLTKALRYTILEVDLDQLLQCIHEYLQELGMTDIHQRPLQMVKTLLHELVMYHETAIKDHLSFVPVDAEPQPFILTYIDMYLQTLPTTSMPSPEPASQLHIAESVTDMSTSPALNDDNVELKMEKVVIADEPSESITIGTLPMSPPKMAMLSPSNARAHPNELHTSPSAGAEYSVPPMDAAYPSLDSIDDRKVQDSLLSGFFDTAHVPESAVARKPIHELPSLGTLDAIRERLKSIQAAAAGNMEMLSLRSKDRFTSHSLDLASESKSQLGWVTPMDNKALPVHQMQMETTKGEGKLENA